jgi:deoxyribonuclease V
LIEKKVVESQAEIPYIPTYLAFREIPIIKGLMKKIKNKPTVLLVDGNGVLHPYGMGIASHLGVELDIPTIGVAKSLLCGTIKQAVESYGDVSEVEFEGKLIGYAYISSKRSKRPIYISPGHRISFKTALEVVKDYCIYKIPQPIRSAHIEANLIKNQKV